MATEGRREGGVKRLVEADARFRNAKSRGGWAGLEAELDQVRALARSAMDWLEEGEEFDRAHALLDRIGNYIRRRVPAMCVLRYAEGSYTQICPVALGHQRVGISVELIIEQSECSICGVEYWECAHVAGEVYGEGECIQEISRATITGAALVSRPRIADARINARGIPAADVQRALRSAPAGAPLVCGICLRGCPGLEYDF